MWTANIDDVIKEKGKLIVRVSYTDGKEADQEEYRIAGPTAESDLKKTIQEKLDALNAVDNVAAKIITGPFVSQAVTEL